jgi:hypothetical protein
MGILLALQLCVFFHNGFIRHLFSLERGGRCTFVHFLIVSMFRVAVLFFFPRTSGVSCFYLFAGMCIGLFNTSPFFHHFPSTVCVRVFGLPSFLCLPSFYLLSFAPSTKLAPAALTR